jgi:hypothetical protein
MRRADRAAGWLARAPRHCFKLEEDPAGHQDPNKMIRVRYSTAPDFHEREGEAMVIEAIDEVTVINK